MSWNLQSCQNELVSPLIYSNSKSQEDVAKEVIEMFESYDIVALKGGVGSGKSAIALRLVSHFGFGIIVVPTKVLQKQYVENYCKRGGYHFNLGSENLAVNFMFGRTNFNCLFVSGSSCADSIIPCLRKLNERKSSSGLSLGRESRIEVASNCEHWSPIYSEKLVERIINYFHDHTPYSYQSVGGQKTFFCSESPCDYYKQFLHYTYPGAIIMNLAKWEAETLIGRKPVVPIEIIDEGDLFLDSLSFKTIFTSKFFVAIKTRGVITEDKFGTLIIEYSKCIQNNKTYEGLVNQSIIEFLTKFVDELEEEVSTSQSIADKVNKANLFLQHLDTTYAQIKYEEITLFLSRPDIVFSEMKKKSGKILIMSATIQTPKIFSAVFRQDNVPLVQAEPKFPGLLKVMFTKDSIDISYKNWIKPEVQKQYYQLLDKIIKVASRPTLVQVHALKYIPIAYKDLLNKDFVDGVSWSTVTDRGIDLPDDKCRSIVITKFPFPDLSNIVFQVLKETYSDYIYWQYVKDIAERELVQQCGRAIRHKDDWCELWSPDSKVLSNILQLWKGKKEFIRIGELL